MLRFVKLYARAMATRTLRPLQRYSSRISSLNGYNLERQRSLTNKPKCHYCTCTKIKDLHTYKRNISLHSRDQCSGSKFQEHGWVWKETRFRGLILDLGVVAENEDKDEFARNLSEYLNIWKADGMRGVFVKIPLKYHWAIPYLRSSGFSCHHAIHDYIMMTKWLPEDEENKIPKYAFHTVGVSGMVLNEETQEALVVQDKGKIKKWKFPGGFAEPNEDIGDTVMREIKEETGIEAEFKALLSFRQQHGVAFNMSDLYFICRLQPLTFDIKICETEIAKCEWLPLDYLLQSEDSTPFTRRVAALALSGLKNGFEDVDIVPERMTSWIPPYDKTFNIFHRPLKS